MGGAAASCACFGDEGAGFGAGLSAGVLDVVVVVSLCFDFGVGGVFVFGEEECGGVGAEGFEVGEWCFDVGIDESGDEFEVAAHVAAFLCGGEVDEEVEGDVEGGGCFFSGSLDGDESSDAGDADSGEFEACGGRAGLDVGEIDEGHTDGFS